MKLRVATCQFPVGADARANRNAMIRQMRQARRRGAHLAHFCEGAISGYAGVDFPSFQGFDWDAAENAARDVARAAGELGLYVVFGGNHRRSGGLRPHNAVYVVDDRGRLIDRYDKRFCAGAGPGKDELAHFSSGDHTCRFTVRGVRCGVLVCHECRYPELYREEMAAGVDLVLHSFHAANVGARRYRAMQAQVGRGNHGRNPGTTLPEIVMPALVHAAAAANHLFISAANSSAKQCCFGSFMVRPDGVITGKLARNRAGVLISDVDPSADLYDSTKAWRRRAMKGQFHSGSLRRDPRSKERKAF
ncbi:carbon-nitrogen hydrolase [Acidobacteria bacterium Mor1]|nr:carbon-nitrogen hydrolase [Acidobacteria bacterium Mor1]